MNKLKRKLLELRADEVGGRLKGGKSKKEAIEGLKSVLRGIVNCLKDKHDRQTKWLQIKK